MTTWPTFKSDIEKAIETRNMNSIKENEAAKWLTKLWPVLLRELTLADCKPIDVTHESVEFTTKDGNKIRFKISQLTTSLKPLE